MDSDHAARSPGTRGPAPSSRVADAFERAADTYDLTGVRFYGPLGRRLVAAAGLTPGMRVLDVGCGRGACTFPAAEAVGEDGSVTAVDAAEAMVEATRRTAAEQGASHVTVLTGDAGRPDFPDGSFDAVLAGLVVFLLPDPAAALRAHHRLLRPGGRFAMSSFGSVDARFFQVTDVLPQFLDEPLGPVPGRSDNAFATKESVAALVSGAGFTRIGVADSDLDIEFADPGQWWDWLWQTAGRMILERIPSERLPQARAAACRRMDEVRDADGRLSLHWNVWLTTAVRGPAATDAPDGGRT
ncbi:class I SAM-dependent methyltransferase [Streptomyces sp. HPF1205]|uniref:class I SAM-dependent methyltransferase n=1 Tax=Streptomyces sp. HPF1205 TaxID=2873262 RepID=UPI001CEDA383|nr:methyltransferase domain-containing protein [Streptomyces sp. HPF1205]